MKLNKENYYTPANNFLTSSKTRDYLKSPEYFFQKHVLNSIEQKKSDALLEGRMLDTLLTEGEDVFEYNFRPVERRSLKNPPTGYTEVTQTMYDACLQRAEKVKKTQAYKDLSLYKKQVILEKEFQNFGKRFAGIAGMLDFLHVDEQKKYAVIIDLKTSTTVDPMKYYWHAIGYGYELQMAWYGWLVHEVYGIDYNAIEYGHLVIEKDTDGINRVGTFFFDKDLIMAKRNMLEDLAYEIAHQENFKDKDVTWEGAAYLGSFSKPGAVMMNPTDEDLESLPS